MDSEPVRLAEQVRMRLDELDTNAFALESARGLAPDTIRNVSRGGGSKSGPTLQKLRQICDALGWELYYGPPRERGPILATEIDGADFAAVPRYNATLSAGDGVENMDSAPVGAIAFRQDWMDRAGISPASSMVVSVRGDSMAPTLYDGDLALIDRRKTQPVGRRIYALIGPDGEARIKRLELLPSALLLQSDNDQFPTELIPSSDADRVRILGEVVWWGHTSKE